MEYARRIIAFIAVAGVVAAGSIVGASALAVATASGPVRIAILDSGITATHQEFLPGQVVAWKDFVNGRPAPYDDNGHGTAVASIAAGTNTSPAKSESLAPGFDLVIGKVLNANNSTAADIGAAVRWAVDVGKADVINLSIYYYLPLTGGTDSAFAAFNYARSKGVLITVCNGNGLLNAGIPGAPGWATSYDVSPSVLSVGAAEPLDALTAHTDPEVTAAFNVTAAAANTAAAYTQTRGTSFAAPYVAGFAARLVETARGSGAPLSPDRLEQLIKYSALDTVLPPTFEGYGVVKANRLPSALDHAAAGSLPPANAVNALYVDGLMPPLRSVGKSLSLI